MLPISSFLTPGQENFGLHIWFVGLLVGGLMYLAAGIVYLIEWRGGSSMKARSEVPQLIDWEALREAAEKKKNNPVVPTSWEYNLNRSAFAVAVGLGVWIRYGLEMSWYTAVG
jgi:hypothetical protein